MDSSYSAPVVIYASKKMHLNKHVKFTFDISKHDWITKGKNNFSLFYLEMHMQNLDSATQTNMNSVFENVQGSCFFFLRIQSSSVTPKHKKNQTRIYHW